MTTLQEKFLEDNTRLADTQQQLALWNRLLQEASARAGEIERERAKAAAELEHARYRIHELERMEQELRQSLLERDWRRSSEVEPGPGVGGRPVAHEGGEAARQRQLTDELREAEMQLTGVKQALNSKQMMIAQMDTNPEAAVARLVAENELASLTAQFKSAELRLAEMRAQLEVQTSFGGTHP